MERKRKEIREKRKRLTGLISTGYRIFNETWYGYKSTGAKRFTPLFCVDRSVHFPAAVVGR